MKLFYVKDDTGALVYEFAGKGQVYERLEEDLLKLQEELLQKEALGTATKEEVELLELVYRTIHYGYQFTKIGEMDKLMALFGFHRLPYKYPYENARRRFRK